MSWESVVLGDVTDTLKGFAFKSTNYSESGIKIVRVSDFTSDSISDIDIKHYPKDSVDKYQKYLLKRDDVLIQTVGSWPNNASSVVGKVVKVPKALDGSLLNQNIVKIYPKSNQTLDNKFLYYCLKSDSFQDHNVGNAVGAANQASITLESIKTYCFNLPPLSIQRRIADILSAYDDLIENNQRQIKLLEEAAMRLYREWFVFMRFPGYEGVRIEDGVPEGWEVKQINDVCLNCASGGTPSRKRREYWSDGSVNWFKTQELVDSWLFDADEKISEKGLENSSAKLFPENTIVMAIYASPTLGRLGILTKESTFNQAALGLVANGDFVSYEWLYLKLLELRDKFNAIASGAGQQNINVKIVQTKEIVVPSHDVMGKFTEIIHPYFEKQKNLTEQIIYLQKARDALLPRLMNGGEGLKLEGGAV